MTDIGNIDADIIEPSIDPKTQKIAIRHVTARNSGGTRTSVHVRDIEPVCTDEPESRVNQLIKNVEYRCPVLNLLRAADVRLNVDWQIQPASGAG